MKKKNWVDYLSSDFCCVALASVCAVTGGTVGGIAAYNAYMSKCDYNHQEVLDEQRDEKLAKIGAEFVLEHLMKRERGKLPNEFDILAARDRHLELVMPAVVDWVADTTPDMRDRRQHDATGLGVLGFLGGLLLAGVASLPFAKMLENRIQVAQAKLRRLEEEAEERERRQRGDDE